MQVGRTRTFRGPWRRRAERSQEPRRSASILGSSKGTLADANIIPVPRAPRSLAKPWRTQTPQTHRAFPERRLLSRRSRAIALLHAAHARACPSGGVRAGGGWGWSLDRATYDRSQRMYPCWRLPPPPFCDAYLRDLAMHPVWCGCRSFLASTVLRCRATAIG
jgi:hypothetical protein